MVLDPSGWRERHMTFAERYAELFSEISDALDKPKGSRRRKGGPPISPLVRLREARGTPALRCARDTTQC